MFGKKNFLDTDVRTYKQNTIREMDQAEVQYLDGEINDGDIVKNHFLTNATHEDLGNRGTNMSYNRNA